jgi:hypothetical protein
VIGDGPLGEVSQFRFLRRIEAEAAGRGGVPILGEMYDPEPDLGFDPSRSGSHTVTLGEPSRTRTIILRYHYMNRQRIAFSTVFSSTPRCRAILELLSPMRWSVSASYAIRWYAGRSSAYSNATSNGTSPSVRILCDRVHQISPGISTPKFVTARWRVEPEAAAERIARKSATLRSAAGSRGADRA